MSFFDQIKQLKQMKDLQEKLGKEQATSERDGVKVTVNGKMEIEEVILNPSLGLKEQQIIVKECANEAMKKIQMAAAQQMMQFNGN